MEDGKMAGKEEFPSLGANLGASVSQAIEQFLSQTKSDKGKKSDEEKDSKEKEREWKTVEPKKSTPMTMALATAKNFTSANTNMDEAEKEIVNVDEMGNDEEEIDLTKEQAISKKVKIEMIEDNTNKSTTF